MIRKLLTFFFVQYIFEYSDTFQIIDRENVFWKYFHSDFDLHTLLPARVIYINCQWTLSYISDNRWRNGVWVKFFTFDFDIHSLFQARLVYINDVWILSYISDNRWRKNVWEIFYSDLDLRPAFSRSTMVCSV